MFRVTNALARAAFCGSVLLLGACGGGGGGGSSSPRNFTVGGSVSGLATGGTVTLRLNGASEINVTANGNFTFPGTTPRNTSYSATATWTSVNVVQTCTVTNATGTVTANVTNITVTCTNNTYRVRGTLANLAGGSVVLRNNGGDNLTLLANGAFEFATPVASGSTYAVTVLTQPSVPSQNCVVSQDTGTIVGADITNVAVNCSINTFTIGGTASGLTGSVVLRNNGGNNLTVNASGPFTFSAPVASGANYLVSVFTQPVNQQCTVTSESGMVGAENVTNVAVTCVSTIPRTIGGTLRGLDAPGLVLRNNGGDDLTVNANGSFTFATSVAFGGTYNVTVVAGTPASLRHVCEVVNPTGTVAGSNVTTVQVTCEADRFAYVAHSSTVSFSGPGLISALVSNFQTGALTPISGTSTFPLDNGAVQIITDPRGRFVYVAHTAVFTSAGSISGFSINQATGALTPVPGSPFTAGMATSSLAIEREGNFLYATNTNSDDVSGWAIAANGSLTPVPGSPYRIGDAAGPVAVAIPPAGGYVYVAHKNINGVPFVSAYAMNPSTGALTPLAGSPYSAGVLDAFSPSSLEVSSTGDLLYMSNSGTSNISTFNISATDGTLTQRAGSPTPAGNAPCFILQPKLSESLLVVSSLSYQLGLYARDPVTSLPAWQDSETMFAGSYCSVATDPYGRFMYVPKFDDLADYLFGFTLDANGTALLPLPLNPLPPENTYTLTAIHPRTMVLRYSRRDREMLQLP